MVDEKDLVFDEVPYSSSNLQPSQSDSILSTIGQSLASAGGAVARGLGAPFSVIESLVEKHRQQLPTSIRPPESPLKGFAPTSENIQKAIETITPQGFTEPKNEWQKFVNENIEDFSGALVTSALTGGVGAITPALAKTTAKSTFGGTTARKGSELAGFGDLGQALAKFGGSVLGGNWGNRKKVEEEVRKNYDLFRSEAENVRVPAQDTEKLTQKFINRSRISPKQSNKDIVEWAESLNNKISEGKMNAVEAADFAQDINAALRSGEIKGKDARLALGQLRDSLYQDPLKNLAKVNKNAYNAWNTAQQDYSALSAGTGAAAFFNKYVPTQKLEKFAPTTRGIIKGIIGTGGLGSVGYGFYKNPLVSTGLGVSAGAGSLAVKEMAKATYLLRKSPTARKLFIDVLKDSGAQNSSKLLKDLNRFNKVVVDFEKKHFDESDLVFD